MLVLTRRPEESIIIGDQIIVTVLAVDGEKVKLGITAPREVRVLRSELWQAIQEQNQIAEQLAAETEPAGFEDLREFLASEISEETEEQDSESPAGEEE